MPGIIFTPLEDDDALTAASLETPLASVEASINDLQENSAREGALNSDHLGTLVIETGVQDAAAVSTLFISGTGSTAHTIVYTTYGLDTTGGPGDDREVLVTGDGTQMSFSIAPTIFMGMSRASRIAGILLRANVEFQTSIRGASDSLKLMVCFQFKMLGDGTWYTIDRSERFMGERIAVAGAWAADTETYQDIPLVIWMTAQDLLDQVPALDPAVDRVEGLRIAVAMWEDPSGAGTSVTSGRAQFSAIPLHAEIV